ncbi:MAG: DUF3291 domain-containing protein [Candidatus Palauibacterales bacterium]|nr:DUF3291 domain-containing protein [Candidatus Palauibacterales bacterium]
MPLITTTRLRLRSRRFLPQLYYYTWTICRQARRTPGFLKGRLFLGSDRLPPSMMFFGRHPGYWTMTMWEDREAMLGFRDHGSHREAMPKGAEWVQEASTVTWEQDSEELPSLGEAHDRMREDGRLMPSNHPSEAHASGEIPEEPNLRSFITFRPADGG